MALHKTLALAAGLVAIYHRLGAFRINATGNTACATLESYADQAARGKNLPPLRRQEYEFPLIGGELAANAYACIWARPEWRDAESDDLHALPAPENCAARLPGEMRWDALALQWVPLRTLDDAKTEKREEINRVWLAATRGTFEFAGHPISCDVSSRSDLDGINGYVAITGELPPGFPGVWKAADNTLIPVPDVATWRELIGAMVAQGLRNFGTAQQLKAQLDAAQEIAEVDAIAWPQTQTEE